MGEVDKETHLTFEVYEHGRADKRDWRAGFGERYQSEGVCQILTEAVFAVRMERSDHDFTPYHEGDSLLVIEALKGN